MKETMKKLMSVLLVSVISLSSFIIPVAAKDTVDTSPIEGITVTTPKNDIVTTDAQDNSEVIIDNNASERTPSTGSDKSSTLVVDDGLKDDLYSGNVLKESNFDLDNFFDRLIVKLRGLVENIRRVAVPILVISWMVLFFIAVLRIVTGERGATSRLMGGLFWVTFAYVGIVSAEAILYSLVKFIIGA